MENKQPENNNGRIFVIVAIVFTVLGAAALGLAFTPLAGYSLIACMLFEVVAITLVNMRRKSETLKRLLYLKTANYLLFIAAVLLLITGVVSL